jgi:hypothetical protein
LDLYNDHLKIDIYIAIAMIVIWISSNHVLWLDEISATCINAVCTNVLSPDKT